MAEQCLICQTFREELNKRYAIVYIFLFNIVIIPVFLEIYLDVNVDDM